MAHVSAHPFDLHAAGSFGGAHGTRRVYRRFVVELRQGDLVGRGEAAPDARYGEDLEEDLGLLKDWAPEIADLEGPAGVETYCEALAGAGVPALRAGLSAAAWDLAGKQAGEPVWRMLGLVRPSVRTSRTVVAGAPDQMLAQARAASAFGVLRVELGFSGDLEVARRLTADLPGVSFRYDVREGWDRERAATSLAVLESLGAELVEQPLPAADTAGMAWLKERTPLTLLADEAVCSLEDLDAVGEAYDGVVVKLAKTGGIAAAFALISACRELGLRVLLGCTVESSLGVAAALQLAGLADHADLDGALLPAADPFTGIEVQGDLLTAPDAPGLGVRPAE